MNVKTYHQTNQVRHRAGKKRIAARHGACRRVRQAAGDLFGFPAGVIVMGGFWRLARGLAGVRTCLIFLNFLRRENVGRPGYDPDQPAGFLPRSQQGRRVFVDGWSQARSGPVGLVFFQDCSRAPCFCWGGGSAGPVFGGYVAPGTIPHDTCLVPQFRHANSAAFRALTCWPSGRPASVSGQRFPPHLGKLSSSGRVPAGAGAAVRGCGHALELVG